MSDGTAAARLEVVVTGRVQGVAFRWHTQRRALTLGLRGRVRNRADGSVQVLAEGDRGALEELLDWLAVGSPHAVVETRDAEWSEARGGLTGFEITG